ncbi:sulfotransferase domain-containing protein [Labrys okinawensis]|uniref:sulfotransferase domain-containing protein n=1 Tax=Labrys okinawensis TaxID=346911 RepID=UPI0039BD306A
MAHHILVACMPKSASTFVTNALAVAAGLKKVELVPEYGRREQELCEIRLAEAAGIHYVAQQHTKHSNWTEQLCNEYRVSIIVLVRSLFDIVVSLRDHIHRESPVSSMFYLEKMHISQNDAEMERMIVMLAIPWYINFYMGWRSSKSARIFAYEDIIADPERAVGEMLAFSGVSLRKEQVAAGIEAASGDGSRINVGKAGRGRSLQASTVSMIMEMLSMYPDIQDDAYVLMMKAQAADILAARADESEVALPLVVPAATVKSASRQPLRRRMERFVRRKVRLFGGTRNQAIAIGLLVLACAYFAFLPNLIPNSLAGGRIDDFAVPAICVFFAARLLTRIKIRRVPVKGR